MEQMAGNHFQALGLIITPQTLTNYVTNFVIIFEELPLFFDNGRMYQKHRMLLMNDKCEAKFILSLLLMIRFINKLESS